MLFGNLYCSIFSFKYLPFSNNLVHGSDGPESSATELALFFSEEGDLIDWTPDVTAWVYSQEELS